ncbi:MAG: DNA mismatch repair protein MutS [Myxococcales bacterium]|nr:DNA mismatch repair protein MutS [Myxococcales bacterium]
MDDSREAAAAKPQGPIKQTPMMKQYLEQKAAHPDCILFFRLGDFYEMFFEDAEVASRALDLTLTSRAKGEDAVPMCGVPYFSAKNYIARLVDQGYKVAICDQMEDPRQAKGLVKRQVTRVISPGMITDPESLDEHESNYLGGVCWEGGKFGFAYLDVSTADFRMTQVESAEEVAAEVERVRVRELLLPRLPGYESLEKHLSAGVNRLFIKTVDPIDNNSEYKWYGAIDAESLRQSGCLEQPVGLWAARLVYEYAAESLPGRIEHVRRLLPYQATDRMWIDEAARVHLELTRSAMGGGRRGSLLDIIDLCRTPMGSRLLRDWMLSPLTRLPAIQERADAVECLVNQPVLRADLADLLGRVRDLERLLSRVVVRQGTPRDLGVLRDSMAVLPQVARLLGGPELGALARFCGPLDELADLFAALAEALVDEPPLDLSEGGAIRPGYRPELDRLVELSRRGREIIGELEERERARTGIASLKVRYNRVFGYYIEVTRPNLHLVPADYRRKQTTANAERFETEELKRTESEILSAQEQRAELERRLVEELTERLRQNAQRILASARTLAACDVIAALADVAVRYDYRRPLVDESERLEISAGRHPVVERLMHGERFVPNDIALDTEKEQLLIITGPNMAGKSTAIRQTALIVILAQMGSFVPADSARVGIVDRLFTRIGAADNLARGQSTFMVEMVETSGILHHATRKSLLVLDEIGRGTSTFDGLSIAWAVAEYIHERIGARTLFATHYHELADLPRTFSRVVNYTVTVKEWKDQIIFLRRLIRGTTSRSYGIQVAKLAGLPAEVIERAKEILANLEGEEFDDLGSPRLSRSGRKGRDAAPTAQRELFAAPARSALDDELERLDPDTLSPLEAISALYRLKKLHKTHRS